MGWSKEWEGTPHQYVRFLGEDAAGDWEIPAAEAGEARALLIIAATALGEMSTRAEGMAALSMIRTLRSSPFEH